MKIRWNIMLTANEQDPGWGKKHKQEKCLSTHHYGALQAAISQETEPCNPKVKPW